MTKNAVAFSIVVVGGPDHDVEMLEKLKAAQAELLLIIEADDVNAFDIVDLRSVIARLEEAILTCKLKR
jgi:hypothetical protein